MVGRGAVKAFTRASIIALLVVLAHSSSAPATVASDLCPSGQDPCEVNTAITVDPGSVIDLGGRGLQLDAAARVTLGAGAVQILAGSVRLRPGARITGATGAAPSSLEIDTTGDIALEASGSTLSRIDLSAAPVVGGAITLKAGGAITVAGNIMSDGPSTEATGGNISLTVRRRRPGRVGHAVVEWRLRRQRRRHQRRGGRRQDRPRAARWTSPAASSAPASWTSRRRAT